VREEARVYLQEAQRNAEKFGILLKDSGSTKPVATKFMGLFNRDVSPTSPVQSDVAAAKKSAEEIISTLTKLMRSFSEEQFSEEQRKLLKADISAFRELKDKNSESWQYAKAVRETYLKILLLRNDKMSKYEEFNMFAVQACLDSLDKLRMDEDEEEAVATISLAEKMIDSVERNPEAFEDTALLTAGKRSIDYAKAKLASGREIYDIESEDSEEVFKEAIEFARFAINTINDFKNPDNYKDNGPPPGMGGPEVKHVPLTKPKAPETPAFIRELRSGPPPGFEKTDEPPPSRALPTDAPPSGIAAAAMSKEETDYERERSSRRESTSGMEIAPPPIPTTASFHREETGSVSDGVLVRSTSSASDAFDVSYEDEIDKIRTPSIDIDNIELESEPIGINETSKTVTNKEKELYNEIMRRFNELEESNSTYPLSAIKIALMDDPTDPDYWDKVYTAVAGYVFSETLVLPLGQGIFEHDVKNNLKIYNAMLPLCEFLKLHSDSQKSEEETISTPGDDGLGKVSLQYLVNAMQPILDVAEMAFDSRDREVETKEAASTRVTAPTKEFKKGTVTFDPILSTKTYEEEQQKSRKTAQDERAYSAIVDKYYEAATAKERAALEQQAEQYKMHYDQKSPFLTPATKAEPKLTPKAQARAEEAAYQEELKKLKEEAKPASILKSINNKYVRPGQNRDRMPSLESVYEEPNERRDSIFGSSVEGVASAVDAEPQSESRNPTQSMSVGFQADVEDIAPLAASQEQVTYADLYLALIKPVLAQLSINEAVVDTVKNKEELENDLILFIYTCNVYFSSNNPTTEEARHLKEAFDDILKDVFLMIGENTQQLTGKDADMLRNKVKSEVSDILVEFAANNLHLERSNSITKDDINGAIALQSITMAAEILNASSDPVESGGGGYCGDSSIIQSMREAVRSGAITIDATHELSAILQPRDEVGKEKDIARTDAEEFRSLYVKYLKDRNLRAGELDKIADKTDVYWLTDQDMSDIAKWLKINLNVVQNVKNRDSTYQYKLNKSIGTINIFNQGYENQDGIHYQALLPISRAEFKDSDYVHVEANEPTATESVEVPPEVATHVDFIDDELEENLRLWEKAQKPEVNILRAGADQKINDQLSAEQLKVIAEQQELQGQQTVSPEILPPAPARGRLSSKQLANVNFDASEYQRNLKELYKIQDKALLPPETVSKEPSGFFSGLRKKIFGSKAPSRVGTTTAATEPTSSSKATTRGPSAGRLTDPFLSELAERLEEQKRKDTVLGSTIQKSNPVDVTPPSTSNLRKRATRSPVTTESTIAPKKTTSSTTKKPTVGGFIAAAPAAWLEEPAREEPARKAESPVIPPQATMVHRVASEESVVVESSVPAQIYFDEIPKPKSAQQTLLVEMVREMINDPSKNTGLGYNDSAPGAIYLYHANDASQTITSRVVNPQPGDTKGGIGKFVATGISKNDTYNVTFDALVFIENLPAEKKSANIYPISVRNLTTREQVMGVTAALYEYCKNTTGSDNTARQMQALKDVLIDSANSSKFKDALYEFLQDIPEIYGDAHDDGNYKSFVMALRDTPPPPSVVIPGPKLGTRPPRVPRDIVFLPLCGLLNEKVYKPKDSSLIGRVKRAFVGNGDDSSPKNRRTQ